jgi:large subunit ribosomal protein L18
MKNKIITMQYKRKRMGQTDYRVRLNLLKSGFPRLVIRKSVSNIVVQVVEYEKDGDRVIVSAHSKSLVKLGWHYGRKNIPACYLTGLLLGKKAVAKGITQVTPDIGSQTSTKGNKIYAAMLGAADAGLKISYSKEIVPDNKRVTGEHIAAYAKHLGSDSSKFEKQFSKKVDYNEIASVFAKLKDKIIKGN